jgi:hypothetical protein
MVCRSSLILGRRYGDSQVRVERESRALEGCAERLILSIIPANLRVKGTLSRALCP